MSEAVGEEAIAEFRYAANDPDLAPLASEYLQGEFALGGVATRRLPARRQTTLP